MLTALAGVLLATPHLVRADPRPAAGRAGDRPAPGPAPGPAARPSDETATDQATESAPDPMASPTGKVTGYAELLPDVAIRCVADPRHSDRKTGRSRDPRLLCAEVPPRGTYRKRPLDGFWD
jgi:hypothetical protein